MDSETLILGLAGNLPYYDPKEYLNPGIFQRVKRSLMDYRSTDYNQPIGKGAHFLFKGIKEYHAHHDAGLLLKLWGNIDSRYASLAREEGIQSLIEISGFIPKEDSLEKLASCDVMVLTLALGSKGNPPFSLPGKMFDYFHVGKPILALVEESYCAQVLRDSGLGIVIDPKDSKAISMALEHLVVEKSEISKKYKLKTGFLDEFGHGVMVERMAKVFDSLS